MKNADLAKKIKELRNRKGFSQDELAEASQLNLRTIQRIESGDTDPRGDTLKRLAGALGITPDELTEWAEEENKGIVTFLNLSALGFLAFPLLGVIIPLSLWTLKKNKIKTLNETGKRLLNFQISWCIAFFLIYILIVAVELFHVKIPFISSVSVLNLYKGDLLVLLAPFLYLINIILIVINAIRSYQNKSVYYQPAIPFLR